MPVHAMFSGETTGGDKYVEVQVKAPGAQTGTDAYGEPTYENVARLYLADVPGPPAWNAAKIETAVAMMQAMLPPHLKIVDLAENPGKAHILLTIQRVKPNG